MEEYLTTGRVARICQVSPMTIAKWIDDGSLRGHITPGGHRRVSASDLVRFLERTGMQVPDDLNTDRRPRVLAVHSDPDYLGRLAEAMLQLHDQYLFRSTTRGVDALVMVGEWRPQVVLLDMTLPDVDGVQICQRLSEGADGRGTSLIALTPEANGPLSRAALAAGAAFCVARDHMPQEVLRFLTEVFEPRLRPA